MNNDSMCCVNCKCGYDLKMVSIKTLNGLLAGLVFVCADCIPHIAHKRIQLVNSSNETENLKIG